MMEMINSSVAGSAKLNDDQERERGNMMCCAVALATII